MKRMVVALTALVGATGGILAGVATAGEPQFPPVQAFVAKASLAGESVVPVPGDPDAAGEFGMNPRRRIGRVCWGLAIEGLDAVTGVTIHKGRRREVGPARLTLLADPAGRPGAGQYHECVSGIRRRLIRRIFRWRDEPRWPWYVQISTAAYPGGAARGQLGQGDYVLSLPDGSGR